MSSVTAVRFGHGKVAVSSVSSGALSRESVDKKITEIASRSLGDQFMEVLKMCSVIITPIVALIFLVIVKLESIVDTYQKAENTRVDLIRNIDISALVAALQSERAYTSIFLSSNNGSISKEPLHSMMNSRRLTDIEMLKIASFSLSKIWNRDTVAFFDRNIPLELRISRDHLNDIMFWFRNRIDEDPFNIPEYKDIVFYTEIIKSLISWISSKISLPSGNTLWSFALSNPALLHVVETVSFQRSFGTAYLNRCRATQDLFRWFITLDGTSLGMQQVSQRYCPTCKTRLAELITNAGPLLDNIKKMKIFMFNADWAKTCMASSDADRTLSSQQWYHNATEYINIVVKLRLELVTNLFNDLDKLSDDSFRDLIIYSTITFTVLVLCGVLCFWFALSIRDMYSNVARFATRLKDNTMELQNEKKRSDLLLHQLLPPKIAKQIERGEIVIPQNFESVTIYFSDIVSFTTLAGSITPLQVVDLLNQLYKLFDECIAKYDAYKVETIGDAYMVASGVPVPNGLRHAPEIANMALMIRRELGRLKTYSATDNKIRMRIGLHTGSCVAAVVGTKMPRYCIFGETVQIANKMESTGEPSKIQITQSTYVILSQTNDYEMTLRGTVNLQGKDIKTYWLNQRNVDEVLLTKINLQ